MTLSNAPMGLEQPGSHPQSSILDRFSAGDLRSEAPASRLQNQVDDLVSHFVEEAANPTTLAALMVGGLAYRYGRIGIMAIGNGPIAAMPLRALSVGFGLGSEVAAFEFTNRTLNTFRATGQSPLRENPNLWSWSGHGGWQEGLIHSALTFGILKSAGFLARDQNIALQHLFQSSAMVGGHQAASLLGLAPRPEGTLAEQMLHAEATNLQLAAGTGMLHHVAPGIHALERSLEISLRDSSSLGGLDSPLKSGVDRFSPLLATGATPFRPFETREAEITQLLMAGSEDGDHKAANDNSYIYPPSTALDFLRTRIQTTARLFPNVAVEIMERIVRMEGEGLLLAKHETLMALARRDEFRSHRELIAAFEELASREEPFPVDALSHELKVLYMPSSDGAPKQIGPYFFQFQNLPYSSFKQNLHDFILEEIFRYPYVIKSSPDRSVLALLQDSGKVNSLLTLCACEAIARLPTLKGEENFGHLIRLLSEKGASLRKAEVSIAQLLFSEALTQAAGHPRFEGKNNTHRVIDLIPETTYWGGAPSHWTHRLIERLAPLLEKEDSFDYFMARLPAENPAFALTYLSRVGAHLGRDSEAFFEILEGIGSLELDPNIVLGHLGLVLANPQLKSRPLIEEALETILTSSATSLNQVLALTALLKNPSISQEQAQRISRNILERSGVDPNLLLETLSILPRYQGEPPIPSETQEVAIARAIDGAFSAPEARMNRPLQFFEVLEKSGADADKMGRALGHIAYNPNIKNALSLSMLLEYFFKRPVSLAVLNLALTEAAKNPHLPERVYQKMVWRIRTQMKIGLAEKKVLIERLAQARQEATAPY